MSDPCEHPSSNIVYGESYTDENGWTWQAFTRYCDVCGAWLGDGQILVAAPEEEE